MKKILVIDDQKDNITTISAVIKSNIQDCKILKAMSGKEGLEIAEKEQPDTILLDIIMPEMDGYEVCQKLKEKQETKHIPIILVTAIKTDSESRVKGLNLGADAFLAKPIDAIELTAQVNVMLRIKAAEDKLRAEKKTLEELVLEKTFELKESEEKYRAIYNNAPLSYQSLDINGCFIDVNPTWLNVLGYEEKEVIGKCFSEFLHPDWKPHFEKNFKEFKRIGNVSDVQFKMKHKDGHYLDISFEGCTGLEPDGSFKQTYCVFQDITKRKLAEEALVESEERYNLAMNATRDGIYDWNLITNEIYYTPAWKKMLGYEDHELPNDFSIWEKLTEAEDVKKSWKMQNEVINKKRDYFEMEFKMKHKDGHWVEILSRAEAVFDESGKAIRMVGTHTDITERKKADLKLNMALNKATESDRLKSSFLATMSHELRTPLNAIIGFSDIIDEDLPVEEIVGFAKTINASGNHLLSIVEDLFDITLIESGEIQIHKREENLHSILNDVHNIIISEQHKTKKEHLDLNLRIPPEEQDLLINTDASKLKQILINLLKNALKFTDKGHIHYGYSIKTDTVRPPVGRTGSRSSVAERSRNTEIEFFVEDTGIGVPKDKQDIIFDVFRQVDETHTKIYGGTGIGLSISKKLTKLLGGKIWIESSENKGSTFYFTLPFESPAAIDEINEENIKPQLKTKQKSKQKTKTVLIVEDDESSFEFLKVILTKLNVNIIWAKNGKDAVECCKEKANIDLILMDINMPIMNGYEATKLIKKIKPHLPIIAQTAYAIIGDRQKSIDAGCDDYISKPIKKHELIAKIEKLLSS